jgi:hypothetical protein
MQLNPRIRSILVAAQLEQGLSAAETARAAQAGELEGLPPTRVSETTCHDLAAEAGRERATQSNGSATSDEDRTRELGDAMAAEADERAYLEQQIARIKTISEPTSTDLRALRTAMAALGDIKKREARRAPRRPVEPGPQAEHSPLLEKLLAAARDEPRQDNLPLADRRHQLGKRWVHASIRRVRAEHPDWDTFAVTRHAGLNGGRPWQFTQKWRRLGGDSHRDLTPEQHQALEDLLDREEAELEQLEVRAQELESAAQR